MYKKIIKIVSFDYEIASKNSERVSRISNFQGNTLSSVMEGRISEISRGSVPRDRLSVHGTRIRGGSGGGKFITGSPIRIISTDAPSTELEHEIGRVATDLEGTSCITVPNGIFPFRFLCSDSPPLLRDSAGDRNCGRIAYSAR